VPDSSAANKHGDRLQQKHGSLALVEGTEVAGASSSRRE